MVLKVRDVGFFIHTLAGPSKVFEVGVYSLENRRLPKVVVASCLCRDEGKMGLNWTESGLN